MNKEVDKLFPKLHFSQQYLPQVIKLGHMGPFHNFLLVGPIYLDFKKNSETNINEPISVRHFHLEVRLC